MTSHPRITLACFIRQNIFKNIEIPIKIAQSGHVNSEEIDALTKGAQVTTQKLS